MDIKKYLILKEERGLIAPFRKLEKMGFLPLIKEYDRICLDFIESYMQGNPNEVLKYTLLEVDRILDDITTFGVDVEDVEVFEKKYVESPKKATLDCMYLSDLLCKNSKNAVKFSCSDRLSNIFAKTRHAFGDTSCLDEWFERFIINGEEIVGMEFADTRWNTLTFGK